jgi:sugar transferase (PEP-CTERM/EpsH1 system associated)
VSASDRPTVLFCIWALEAGGAERFLVELAKRIPGDRFHVKIVCLSRKGAWAGEVESAGIEVVSLDKRTGIDFGILFRLIGLFRRERPAIVNTHLWTADVWARAAAVLAGVPQIVVTEQNVDLWKTWLHRLIDRILFHWTNRVICVSDEVRDFYRKAGVPARKLEVIPNAIDLRRESTEGGDLRDAIGARPGDFVFLCAARLHPQKAHHVLIDAAGRLIQSGLAAFRIALAGEGTLRTALEEQVRVAGLGEHVRFLGFRNDVRRLLPQADAFVLPSLYEGLPLAVLEAMAASLPVVATAVGGNAAVVEDGRSGLIVAPGDAAALAAAMSRLVEDRDAARAMGKAGRHRVEAQYDIESAAARTSALFEECLASRR